MLIPGTLLQNRYRIIRQIGGGGQALVYLAEDTNLGSLRAIKELTPDLNASPQEQQAAYDQFEREARILIELNHPNLVWVWDHFRVGGNAYLVMDYIDGQTLQEIMDHSLRFLPEAAVLRWAGQLCDVLDYLHRQPPPIIFRDLKPSNVMLDRSDTVKLIDFGIVRFFQPGKKTDTLKMGTMGYAPPEQYAGKGQTDARSDIYSLGATLHHLLTKRDPTQHPPFSFNTAPPRSLNPAVSPHVEAAITKALAYDRVHRFQSAQEMKRALMGAPVPTPTVTIPRPAPRRQIKLRWPLLGLAAFIIVLAWFLLGRGEPRLRPTPTVAPAVVLATNTPTPMPPLPTAMPSVTPPATPAPASLAQLEEMLWTAWDSYDWELLIGLIEQILAIEPDYDDMPERLYAAYVNYGYQLLGEGDPDGATAQFNSALDIKPDGIEALAGLQEAATWVPTPVANP
ncbi:MAG: serine/threonine protein kinase [Anaerolineae bacterium]|nr:serine/threonine protein kinase [Anaerolineae bacterium]